MRSYNQFCALANALDIVGDRWALLVVRELLLGPKRFTDLRAGLPRIPTNVLSSRLRELEASGVLQRRALPPPAAATVYELTEHGRGLEDAVFALGRWGARTLGMPCPDRTLRSGWLGVACKAFANREAAQDVQATVELRLEDGVFHARIANGDVELTDGAASDPDLVLETTNVGLLGLFGGMLDADEAVRNGAVRVSGASQLLPGVLRVFRFPRPEPAEPQTVGDPPTAAASSSANRPTAS
jgi:DNA-binding HxlR family transcriptional regulator